MAGVTGREAVTVAQTERQKSYDVFISYSHKNEETAKAVIGELEQNGVRCWYAPSNILSGDVWAKMIADAIPAARMLLLLFSKEANESPHVLREVAIASEEKMPIFLYRMDNTQESGALKYYLAGLHWLDSTALPLQERIPALREETLRRLGRLGTPVVRSVPTTKVPEGTLSKEKFHEWVNPPVVKTLEFQNTLENVPSHAVDLSEESDGSVLGWTKGASIYIAGIGGVFAPEDCSWLLSSEKAGKDEIWSRLQTIRGGANLDTSKVKNMSGMFSLCEKLTAIDVSCWNTCEVTDMSDMFANCTSLSTLDVSLWDTSMVTDMEGMFGGCINLTTLDISRWDTSRVTDMRWMFIGCFSLLALDVSHWDTSNVKDTTEMFIGTRWVNNPPI